VGRRWCAVLCPYMQFSYICNYMCRHMTTVCLPVQIMSSMCSQTDVQFAHTNWLDLQCEFTCLADVLSTYTYRSTSMPAASDPNSVVHTSLFTINKAAAYIQAATLCRCPYMHILPFIVFCVPLYHQLITCLHVCGRAF